MSPRGVVQREPLVIPPGHPQHYQFSRTLLVDFCDCPFQGIELGLHLSDALKLNLQVPEDGVYDFPTGIQHVDQVIELVPANVRAVPFWKGRELARAGFAGHL